MSLFELALEMGIPVAEMVDRMSAHELCVEWPCFFEVRAKLQEQLRALEGSVPPERFEQVRTMGN